MDARYQSAAQYQDVKVGGMEGVTHRYLWFRFFLCSSEHLFSGPCLLPFPSRYLLIFLSPPAARSSRRAPLAA